MYVFQSTLRPRNPLVRLIGGILGLFAVLGLLALGVFAFAALVVGGAIWYVIHLLRAKRFDRPQAKPPKAEDGVIDGEFTVVGDSDRRLRIDQPNRSEEHPL